MEVQQSLAPASLGGAMDDHARVDLLGRTDQMRRPNFLNDNMRAKSALGHSLPTPDDSPPRPEERRHQSRVKADHPVLPVEEALELFRTRVEDARRDTHQLAGSEDMSEVAIPKLTLDLGYSNIEMIPDTVVDLIKAEVERLSLSHNHIWLIPTRIAECSHLRYLNLRSNVMRDFPKGIWKLPLLEILDISRNKIRKLPKDIKNMTSLRVFSIVHNRIDDLPPELCEMTKLQILKFAENPLKQRLRKVIENKEAELDYAGVRGMAREQAITAEIKHHLRDLHPAILQTDVESGNGMEDYQVETPKPLKRVTSSRFPVVPSGTSIDAASAVLKNSPDHGLPPPIPQRSHNRIASGQQLGAPQSVSSRRSSYIGMGISAERNRSNSDTSTFVPAANTRSRRMGMLRKEKSDLDAIDETRVIRQSHLRVYSYNSSLRRHESSSSPLIGFSSPSSPRVHLGAPSAMIKRLSTLQEVQPSAKKRHPVVNGAYSLVYSLYQIETQIRVLVPLMKMRMDGKSNNDEKPRWKHQAEVYKYDDDEPGNNSFEYTFHNAMRSLRRLDKTLGLPQTMNYEEGDMPDSVIIALQQNCVECVVAYQQLTRLLQRDLGQILGQVDPRYLRTFMLMFYGSIIEIKNALKEFGVEVRGHKRQMSSGNPHHIQTIPEELTASETSRHGGNLVSVRSETAMSSNRLRSDTTIQRPNGRHFMGLQAPQLPQPPNSARLPPIMGLTGAPLAARPSSSASTHANGTSWLRSRSSSRNAFSAGGGSTFGLAQNDTHLVDEFNDVPSASFNGDEINLSTGLTIAQEDLQFEEIFIAVSRSCEAATVAISSVRKQFERCLEVAELKRQPKENRDLWQLLTHRCRVCEETRDSLKWRINAMPPKSTHFVSAGIAGGRNDAQFWVTCKAYLQSFVDIVTDMKEAKDLRILPPDTLRILRPVQVSSRDAGRLIDASPWRNLTEGTLSMPVARSTGHGAFEANAQSQVDHVGSQPNGTNGITAAESMNLHNNINAHSNNQLLPTSQANLQESEPISSSAVHLQPPGYAASFSTVNGSSPTVQVPATPLSAALGPAALATVPSTPASAYGDQFFKGDVFQRAESLLSMQPAGSVNFLNRR